MTQPVDITAIIPNKAKTWVGLIGSLLTIAVPYLLQYSTYFPDPWPLVLGAVIAVLTTLGIYKAPYKPTGTILAVDPSAPVVSDKVPANAPTARPTYVGPSTSDEVTPPPAPEPYTPPRNPWKSKRQQ